MRRATQKSPSADSGKLAILYKGDEAHAGFDNVTFLSEDKVTFVEDAGDGLHAARNALDSGFVLDVTRVVAIEEEVEIRQWTVETKQGNRSFQTHLDDWPRVLPGGGLLIRDVAGDLYRLADPKDMDRASRELLWAFVD